MVLDWWREVLDGGHLEQTSKYQAEDYIQHNPNVPTGRAGFVEFFSKFAKPKNPIPDKLANPPVVMGAKGDFVWLVFETEQKGPARSVEDLPLQQLRRAAHSERQGAGALGQRAEE